MLIDASELLEGERGECAPITVLLPLGGFGNDEIPAGGGENPLAEMRRLSQVQRRHRRDESSRPSTPTEGRYGRILLCVQSSV